MINFVKVMWEKETKTPEGIVNFLFGIFLIIGFGIIEVSSGIKEAIWRLIFHTEPTNNSFLLLLGIIIYLVICVLIVFWADIYRKKNF